MKIYLTLFLWSFKVIFTKAQLDVQGHFLEESRGYEDGDSGILNTIIPVLFFPYLWQTISLPFSMLMMKLMIAKSIFLGKIALLLWIFTFWRNRMTSGGNLYSHNISVKEQEGHKLGSREEYNSNYEQYSYNSNYDKYQLEFGQQHQNYYKNNDNYEKYYRQYNYETINPNENQYSNYDKTWNRKTDYQKN